MTRKATGKETVKAGRANINERLHEAIDGLRKDVTRVEIWATALGSFTQPVPDYNPSTAFELPQNVEAEKPPMDEPATATGSGRKGR